ncbi:putative oxidoreductase, partial [Xylariomycetidae sp. FL0641]
LGAEKVILPGNEDYDASLSSYFIEQTPPANPVCFVVPHTAEDVAIIIKTLANVSRESSVEFAIRSGGHMMISGAASMPGGVTIDLRRLNSIELRDDNSTVSIGVGATWDAVYNKLDPLELTVVGSRVAGVGVGGCTLGGGISFLGPRYGWICDTVQSFEVVLADGSVVVADEDRNQDLLYGLRGGCNNFGVVTRVSLKTFHQGPLWVASIYHPLSIIDDQARIISDMTAPANYDKDASIIVSFGYSGAHKMSGINNHLVYTKPVEQPKYFENLLNLPSIFSTSSIMSMEDLSQSQAQLLPKGCRYAFATTTFKPTEAMIRAAYDAWESSLKGVQEKVQNTEELVWALSLDPVPPSMYQPGSSKSAMGLTEREGTLFVCLLTQGWTDEADDAAIRDAADALIKAVEDAARELNAYDPFLYLNYATKKQGAIASYGEANVRKMRRLQDRVDPERIFTRLVPGGFKIPASDEESL